jgi:hypothetical protein
MDGVNEAIALLTSSNDLHYQIWMFYVVVALGLIGYRFSESYDKLPLNRRIIVIVGFVAFSGSNLFAMYQNMVHFNTVLTVLQKYKYSGAGVNLSTVFAQYHEKGIWRVLIFQAIITLLLSYVLSMPKDKRYF